MNIVFAIVYKEILQLAFVEDLLDMLRYEFVTKIHHSLVKQGSAYITLPRQFDPHFGALLLKWEQKARELQGPKQMRTFDQTSKGKKLKDRKGGNDSAEQKTP